MKRVFFLTIIALASTLNLRAQHTERPNFDAKDMASKNINELSKIIELPISIQDSIKIAFVNFFHKMDADRQSGERSNIENYEKERNLKVKTFLTDEQYRIYAKFMADRKPKSRLSGGESSPTDSQDDFSLKGRF